MVERDTDQITRLYLEVILQAIVRGLHEIEDIIRKRKLISAFLTISLACDDVRDSLELTT